MTDGSELPDEIDMANAADVARVKARRDPALWHQAAMAVLAYIGDPHGFLPWLVQQPEMDRATAGWIFLWAEGSSYLRGEAEKTFALLDHFSARQMISLFDALCERSERMGFGQDRVGLDKDFEAERQRCLDVVVRRQLGAGIKFPSAIIGQPFRAPTAGGDYEIDDGLLVRT
jgi:hypothetical protein